MVFHAATSASDTFAAMVKCAVLPQSGKPAIRGISNALSKDPGEIQLIEKPLSVKNSPRVTRAFWHSWIETTSNRIGAEFWRAEPSPLCAAAAPQHSRATAKVFLNISAHLEKDSSCRKAV